MKSQFLLNPKITYLNHGSFGACPKPIFESYQNWQQQLEIDPVHFIINKGQEAMNKSKKVLADFIKCDPIDLVFTPNPSYALNTVIRSLNLNPGDEILTTDQEYGAMDRTWNYYAKKTGAVYKKQKINLPVDSKDRFLDAFFQGLTKNTKIVFISHITSSTGLIFPIEEICKKANELGILSIIDGAHVPGHIPLNIEALNPTIYTGACHKWMLAPKGTSFLFVKKDFQKSIDPLVISWGYNSDNPTASQFQDYHQMQGTTDFSSYLTIPDCIEFFNRNNWKEETKQSRDMLIKLAPIVAKELESNLLTTNFDDFLGQMCSIPIKTTQPIKLKEYLYHKENIEIPIMEHSDKVYLRLSFQPYNTANDIEKLVDAIRKIKTSTTLL